MRKVKLGRILELLIASVILIARQAQCDVKARNNNQTECTKPGTFPDRKDEECRRYYVCEHIIGRVYDLRDDICPQNFRFHPALGKCSSKANVPCNPGQWEEWERRQNAANNELTARVTFVTTLSPFREKAQSICTGPGRFPHEDSKHKYYECFWDTDKELWTYKVNSCGSKMCYKHGIQSCFPLLLCFDK